MITIRDNKGRIAKGSNQKHGLSDHPVYDCWVAMKARCYNKKNHAYKWYGARGIKVCDQWLNSFEDFLNDMGMPKGKTLDRINVNGNYSPDNCRWITHQEQQLNRTNNNKHPGVSYEKSRNKYVAEIRANNKRYFLGRFDLLEDAQHARRKAEVELWRTEAQLR